MAAQKGGAKGAARSGAGHVYSFDLLIGIVRFVNTDNFVIAAKFFVFHQNAGAMKWDWEE